MFFVLAGVEEVGFTIVHGIQSCKCINWSTHALILQNLDNILFY